MTPPLVLASTSRYRAEILRRLALEFIQVRPGVEENPLADESPHAMALRLAEAKARALAVDYPNHLIIGSDQTAGCDQDIIGKPGSRDRAIGQLLRFSGRNVNFHTGVCLLNTRTGQCRVAVNTTTVTFRPLTLAIAERYVDREQPLDCAGSFKAEGMGIVLFSRIVSDDPTSLIGLPLITLTGFLLEEGWMLP